MNIEGRKREKKWNLNFAQVQCTSNNMYDCTQARCLSSCYLLLKQISLIACIIPTYMEVQYLTWLEIVYAYTLNNVCWPSVFHFLRFFLACEIKLTSARADAQNLSESMYLSSITCMWYWHEHKNKITECAQHTLRLLPRSQKI